MNPQNGKGGKGGNTGMFRGAGTMSPAIGGGPNLLDPEELQQMLGVKATPPYSLSQNIQPRLNQMQIKGMPDVGTLGASQGPGIGSQIAQYAPQVLSALGGRSGTLQGAAQGAATGGMYGGPWGALGGGLGGALMGRKGASAASMAGAGAQLGTLAAPGIGTGIGAGAGALMGLLSQGKGGQKRPMNIPITPITPDIGE